MSTQKPASDWCWARAPTGWCTPAASATLGYASPSRRFPNGTAGAVNAGHAGRAPGWAGLACSKAVPGGGRRRGWEGSEDLLLWTAGVWMWWGDGRDEGGGLWTWWGPGVRMRPVLGLAKPSRQPEAARTSLSLCSTSCQVLSALARGDSTTQTPPPQEHRALSGFCQPRRLPQDLHGGGARRYLPVWDGNEIEGVELRGWRTPRSKGNLACVGGAAQI